MGEGVFFRNLTTKGLTAINSGERYFEGYLTVQVKDKQGEVTIVDELMKVLPIWIDRGAPISDTHSNRIIGKGINYSKVEYKDKDGEVYPAIKITGKIHKNYELDTDIWSKIKSGEYKGLSFGGATKSDREPMRMKDGSIAYSLKDLEHYEVAVCRDPAVPLALITEYNTLAKAATEGQDLGDGRMLIKCSKFGCYVDKNNKEGGLKAPEAAQEAIVYNDNRDKPIELEAKSDEGEGTKQDVEEYEAIHRHATEQDKGVRDRTVAKPDEPPKEKQIAHDVADKIGYTGKSELEIAEKTEKNELRRQREEKEKLTGLKWHSHPDNDHLFPAVGPGSGTSENRERVLRNRDRLRYGDSDAMKKREEEIHTKYLSDGKFWTKPEKVEKGEDETYGQYCTSCGEKKPPTERVGAGGSSPSFLVQDDSTSTCPNCKKKGEDEEKRETTEDGQYTDTIDPKVEWARRMVGRKQESKKGEDWSNADGDMHSMYNQDTDEGGMGKHKQKGCKCGDPKCKDPKCNKREVGTGYGAEQNSGGEVNWQGSGSPYPKKKGYSDEVKEGEGDWDQQEYDKKSKKTRKKKAIMTNIYSRLKSLDFMLKRKPYMPKDPDTGFPMDKPIPTEMFIDQDGKRGKKESEKTRGEKWEEYYHWNAPGPEGNMKPLKKKSFYQAVKDGEFGGMNTGETEWTEPRDSSNERRDSNTKKKAKESTVDETGRRPDGSIPWTKERQAKFQAEHEEKKLNTEANLGGRPQLTNPKDNEAKKKLGIQGKVGRPEKQATPQSKHTRRTSQEAVTAIEASVKLAEEKDKENKRKKEEEKGNQSNINPKDEKKLDERYGSERIPWVDYTLPKDDGVEKAEEGIGGMTTGAQRGLGHEGGNKQGPGESTQVTEVVEEESKKSAYENHEQDESPDSESNKQQIPPSKPGMDVVKTRLKLLKIKYSNIYKHRKI